MSDLRVGMVFGSGGLGAGGYYNEMGLKGLRQAQDEFGVSFEYRLPEADADFEPYLDELAQGGSYALICVMSFGASPGLERVADKYPDQKFAAFDAFASKPNVANYSSESKGAAFLAGAAAAWLSQSGKVGTLFGTEGVGYWQWVASYAAGAKYALPGAEVSWEFLADWSPEPALGEAAADRLYDQGVDVIMAHLDTGDAGVFAAAKARGTYAFGFNGERDLDPEHVILDVTRHLEVCIFDAVEHVVQGTFEAGETHWGMERGQYGLEFGNPLHPKMTETVLKHIEALKKEIDAGEFDPLPATHEEVEPFLKEKAPQAGREIS